MIQIFKTPNGMVAVRGIIVATSDELIYTRTTNSFEIEKRGTANYHITEDYSQFVDKYGNYFNSANSFEAYLIAMGITDIPTIPVNPGDPSGFTNNVIPYINGSGNWAEDTDFYYDGTNLYVEGGYVDTNNGYYQNGLKILNAINTSSVLLGVQAGNATMTGDYNYVQGYAAGFRLTTGYGNNLQGYLAGVNLTTGFYNIGIGTSALSTLTNRDNNIGIGYYAMASSVDVRWSTAIGHQAGQMPNISSLGGLRFLAIGDGALSSATITTARSAVGIGTSVGVGSIGIDYSFLGGELAGGALGATIATRTGAVALGYRSMYNRGNGYRSIAIGYNAGYSITADALGRESIYLGAYSGDWDSADYKLHIGYLTGVSFIEGHMSQHWLKHKGSIIIGKRTSGTDIEGEIRYNDATNKHQGYDGTTWNDMY